MIDGLIGAAVGAWWIGYLPYRWYRNVRTATAQLQTLRASLIGDVEYRPPGPGDGALVARLAVVGTATDEATRLGATVLGDLVAQMPGQAPLGIMRCFVCDDRTTLGLLGLATRRGLPIVVGELRSHADDAAYVTRRTSTANDLARAPFHHGQTVDPALPLARALERHREFATDGPFRRVETLDEFVGELMRWRARAVAWRLAQNSDELLEWDLRGLLGRSYPWYARALRRNLKLRVPEARIV